jgi:SAM-dependent methyltransferase
MTTEHARAGADWLALREPADAAARSSELVETLHAHLPTDGMVVHDLGCGTGSMTRWLAPRLSGPQRWVLHDRDAELLERATSTSAGLLGSDGGAVTVETRRGDITRLDPGELNGVSLITASAVLDMFTHDELERFVTLCAGAGCPTLVTLSVVGRVDLAPAHPLDPHVMTAFNAHQTRPTAGGPLLGPNAAGAAVAAFERLGLEVLTRPSPWRLGSRHSHLAAQWLTGWVDAACEQAPHLAGAARVYAVQRRAETIDGSVSITVHHEDLLALPAG